MLGTITAWVLVRDDFRGKSLVNAIIDLPFALPTIVAGLVAARALRAAVAGRHQRRVHAHGDLPRAAVRDAAVRRPDGAAGAARARRARWRRRRARSARASSRVFRADRAAEHPPGILSGVALAFARAVGEIGALVLISRQPARTRPRSPRSSSSTASRAATGRRGRGRGRAARDLVRAAARDRRAPAARHEARACVGYGLRVVALGYLLGRPARAAGDGLLAHVRARRSATLWDALTDPNTMHAFKLTLIIAAIAVPLNTVFGIVVRARDRPPALPGQRASSTRSSTCRSRSRRSSSGSRSSCSTAAAAGSAHWFDGARDPDPLRAAVDGARDDLRLAAVRRARGRADAARDRRRAGAGRAHARRRRAGRRSGGSRCRRSAGR